MGNRVRLLFVATAVAASVTPAYAGPVGSGAGTGIVDWLSVYQDLGNGHSATAHCEYAVNPGSAGPDGHFEAGATALTGGMSPSTDAVATSVSCAFYGTASGTLVLSDAQSGAFAQRSHDQAVRRPTYMCLRADFEWTNGDTVSMNRCRRSRIYVEYEDVVAELTPGEETERLLETAGDTADDVLASLDSNGSDG